jgi:hypothetical protein
MTWGFVWLMFILKIPILMLLGIVWWAIKAETNPAGDDGSGGIRRHRGPPLQRLQNPLRPGPHGAPLPPAPARVRTRAVSRRTPAAPHR